MASSRWAMFMNRISRTTQVFRDNTASVLKMQGADGPSRAPISLVSFNTSEDIRNMAIGCDSDIGGTSSAHLDFVPDKNDPNGKGKGRFWGEMRLGVRGELQGKVRGGYAGFRSKSRPTLFGEVLHDVSNHEFMALRLRVGGHPRTRNSYFINVQTDSPVTGELWQHRLYFRKDDGSWEDIFIPLSAFVLTSFGQVSTGTTTASMVGDKIRWVGISLLGGNAGVEGPFELGLDSIKVVNREDVTSPILREGSDGTPWERGPLL